jgi:hypothetical protein
LISTNSINIKMSEDPFLILVAGYAGSGKTTAAALLAKLLKPYNVQVAAFADAVKEETSRIYKYPLNLAFTQEGKKSLVYTDDGPKTVREILIEYSLDAKQRHGYDVWARRVAEKILSKGPKNPWILHDWRFLHEAQSLKSILKPTRMITVRIERAVIVPMEIPSERELDYVLTTHTIENNGTLADLENDLAAMLRNYFPEVREA